MAYAHTVARPAADLRVDRAVSPHEVHLNWGKVVTVVLTRAELEQALAAIQAEIDAHMAAHPVIARSA